MNTESNNLDGEKYCVSIIAAIQKKDRGLGYQNQLLTHLSDDLKRFKALTTDHPIVMGRKTFESIGRALPGRTNIVITSNDSFRPEGVIVKHSLDEALKEAAEAADKIHGCNETFVIGGGEIYKQALPFADKLYLTIVDTDKPADTFFPEYSNFKKVISEIQKVDEKTVIPYTYLILEK